MPVGSRRLVALLRNALVASALAAAAVAVGCGDEGRTGSKDAPVSAPGSTPASTTVPPPAGPGSPAPLATPTSAPAGPASEPSAPVSVRVGDWVTWEIKVDGVAGKTTLTWRATAVEGERVRIRVESSASDATGKPTSSTSSEQWIPTPRMPELSRDASTVTVVTVGTKTLKAHPAADGSRPAAPAASSTVAYAAEIPLGGVALRSGDGVDQRVVAYGRGP